MKAYYNENDPFAAQWLRNLIAAGHIAAGDVDDRSIKDVQPEDLKGYTQCHFFAGIGGWSYALRLAGWPDDKPVWTGSCPCQPFSAAGKQKGVNDERHLWPDWFRLIKECKPAIIFGEQVDAAVRWGWLGLVSADLEGQGYACGAAILPACGVGAPHIRQRLWFVADADGRDAGAEGLQRGGEHRQFAENGSPLLMADTLQPGRPEGRPLTGHRSATGLRFTGEYVEHARFALGHADSKREAEAGGISGGAGIERQRSPWAETEWLECRDGKKRPVEPGTFPLAHGIPGRVGRLRAYGNAIVPQVAAEFIKACLSS